MNILLRTFNNKINSKTGTPLPPGQYRGTPEWLQFESILIDCLKSLGHVCHMKAENPLVNDDLIDSTYDKVIVVHKCRRDQLSGDLFWMQMHMRYLFTVDVMGWGADNSNYPGGMGNFIHEDEGTAEHFCQNLSDELLSTGISKCKQAEITDSTPSRFILVPVQIPRDYTLKYHSPVTVRYFVDSIQSWAVETENHVCFKMHPFNKGDIDLHIAIDDAAVHSRYVHKVEGNIHELIKRSAGLFVINSGTGFEALVHGKPVATFGACDYNLVTNNSDLRRLDEARNFIYSYREEWKRTAYKFVHWYHTRFAYDIRFVEDCKQRLTEYLRGALQ